jgi:hypothetical protein
VSPWGEEDPDTILKNNETIKRPKHKRTSSLKDNKTPEKSGTLIRDSTLFDERRNVSIFEAKRVIDGTPLKEIEDSQNGRYANVFPDPFEKGMMKSYSNYREIGLNDAFSELKRSATYKELRENSMALSKKTGLAYKKFI